MSADHRNYIIFTHVFGLFGLSISYFVRARFIVFVSHSAALLCPLVAAAAAHRLADNDDDDAAVAAIAFSLSSAEAAGNVVGGGGSDCLLGVWTTTTFNYVPNRRGGLNLIHNGYLYTTERKYNSTVNWVCNKNSNMALKCPARCVTAGEHSIKLSKKPHNHEPIFDEQHQHELWLEQQQQQQQSGSSSPMQQYHRQCWPQDDDGNDDEDVIDDADWLRRAV